MAAPLLWLVSDEARDVTGKRIVAARWREGEPLAAVDNAGWDDGMRRPLPSS